MNWSENEAKHAWLLEDLKKKCGQQLLVSVDGQKISNISLSVAETDTHIVIFKWDFNLQLQYVKGNIPENRLEKCHRILYEQLRDLKFHGNIKMHNPLLA